MRENPVPTILGALGLGIAIGLAIRYAAPSERKREIVVESPFGKFNWSVLSLPFLWPLFKSAREKSEDVMRNGVKQWKKMDVESTRNRFANAGKRGPAKRHSAPPVVATAPWAVHKTIKDWTRQ